MTQGQKLKIDDPRAKINKFFEDIYNLLYSQEEEWQVVHAQHFLLHKVLIRC